MMNYKLIQKENFQYEQKKAWIILLYQIFKVYSRVNPGKLKKNCEFWVKYNAREKLLLNWLEKTYQSEANVDTTFKEHEILSDLNNGEMLSALISKYTNIKILDFYGKPIKGLKQKQKRCKSVIETFNQIGINCQCRV